MSQLTATARPALRGPVRRAVPRQPLRVVPGAVGRTGNGAFAGLCVTLLVAGLMTLLLLNTAMAQDSFTLHEMQARSSELADTKDALTQALDRDRAPARLAQRATALGMVPAGSPAFLRLEDGRVLGVAKPASAADRLTVVTSPVPVAPPAPVRATAKEADKDPSATTKTPTKATADPKATSKTTTTTPTKQTATKTATKTGTSTTSGGDVPTTPTGD